MLSSRLKVFAVAVASVVALTAFLEATQASSPSGAPVSVVPVQVRLPVDANGNAPPDPGAAAAAAYSAPQVPTNQITTATGILAADPTFKKLLGTRGFSIAASAPWTDGTGTSAIGVDLTVRLSAPVSSDAALPVIAFHSDERTFDQRVEHVHFDGASEFDALVDLNSGQLVRLMPKDASLNALPGHPLPTSTTGTAGSTGD